MITNVSFPCTVKSFSYPLDWKTAIVPTPFGHGGLDAHAGSNDWLQPRTVTIEIVHVYRDTETYKIVSNNLEAVISQGNPLELTTQEEDQAIWLWSGLRLQKYDKKLTAGDFAHYAIYPLTFIAPDPQQRALAKPGTLVLDNGLYLDDTPVFYLDTDPDNFVLGATSPTSLAINNSTGISPDFAPIIDLFGPITGPIFGQYQDSSGLSPRWTYNASVAAGEQVRIDAVQQDVSSSTIGSAAYQNFTAPFGTDLWGIIRPGSLTFTLSYTSAASPANATVGWAPRK